MEGFDCTIFDGAARKKRSRISRRPRPESQPYPEFHDRSSLSSTPSLDDVGKVSCHENGFDTNPMRKERNLGHCFSPPCAVGGEDEKSRVKNVENELFTAVVSCEEGQSGNKPSGKGILASANRKNTSKVKAGLAPVTAGAEIYIGRKVESQNSGKYGGIAVGLGNENKVKKVVKLKVVGVTHTFHANSSSKISYGDMPSAKNYQSSEASRLGPENPQQGDLWHDHYVPDRRSGLQGIRRKDSSHGGFNFRKEDPSMVKMSGKNTSGKVGDKLEPVRKSKRVPKRRMFNGEFGEEDDDEILYLEKLKMNVDASYKEEEGPGKRQRELSKVGNIENGSSKSVKYWRKKLGPERASDDMDFQEDEVLVSDGELESDETQKKDSVDTSMDGKKEFALTTRRRSLQSNKDGSSTRGSGLIEFPDGLPPAPSRKQKEKLSAVEEQLKKTEAAQRRKMQVEKAAKESQDEAIRKILGQDSGRKKREEKIKQRQEEIAQERAANALKVAPNTIRCVDGPTGTVVTFSDDMVLPSIFDSKPRSYPPPRELCAGPSCANPYKYRHSKLGVPLCSLKCYKAVEEQMLTKTTN